MSFISYEFLILFSLALFACWSMPAKSLNPSLVIASYVFYGWWDWRFLALILFSTAVDFGCGLYLENPRFKHRRFDILCISICVNLGALLTFKYYDFFVESFCDVAMTMGIRLEPPLMQLILPVGISFYTFQTLSYTIDVYRGKLRATNRFVDFMLFVSFFPQLVAGPIERASSLLPQIAGGPTRSWEYLTGGAQLMLAGFFKKMVVADNLAPVVDAVYSDSGANGLAIVLATYAFAVQIYCDFSGYTDIARGAARMMGYQLGVNFNLPYLATSPSDFWRRWHISLSSWIRDYLFIPLGGSRGSRPKIIRNLLITMFLAGLWHGASWHFVLWGLYHGLLLVLFAMVKRHPKLNNQNEVDVQQRPRIASSILAPIAFFQLTCLGWFLFRVSSMKEMLNLALSVLDVTSWNFDAVDPTLVYRLALFGIPLMGFQIYQYIKRDAEPWVGWSTPIRVGYYLVLFYAIVLWGTPDRSEFIYFQF